MKMVRINDTTAFSPSFINVIKIEDDNVVVKCIDNNTYRVEKIYGESTYLCFDRIVGQFEN